MKIFLFLLLSCQGLWAAEKQNTQVEKSGKVFVQSFDSDVNLDILKNDAYEKRGPSQLKDISLTNSLPSPGELQEILGSAKLSEETKNFDQMDIDVLCLYARAGDLQSLRRKYPQISVHKLKALVKEMKKRRG